MTLIGCSLQPVKPEQEAPLSDGAVASSTWPGIALKQVIITSQEFSGVAHVVAVRLSLQLSMMNVLQTVWLVATDCLR